MADAPQEAIGKMDGRNPNSDGYDPYKFAGVTHYQEWAFGKNWVNRPEGADEGKKSKKGGQWWSPALPDKGTVLSEILTKKYHGQTVLHMIAAIFAVEVEGHDPDDVREALGLPEEPLPLKETGADPKGDESES